MVARAVGLDDKYEADAGRVYLTGLQAVVRVPFDQHQADAAAGLRTGALVSGYQGSPLGTLDKELLRIRERWAGADLVFRPGLNEELAATAVWGSQLATQVDPGRWDGVVGYWYGKSPGLDRAADAIRHANLCGVGPAGGALAVVGDDPACKSSTLPSASEATLAALGLPTLWPGTVQEVLDLGRHAVALSRLSGLWVGFKVVTAVADAAATAEVGAARVVPVLPEVEVGGRPYVHRPNPVMLAPDALVSERNQATRLELARAYSRANGLNRVADEVPGAWLGIAAAGRSHAELRQALADLGLDRAQLRAAGVRVLQVGMVWPLEAGTVREWAHGLDEVLVVEDKGFLEPAIKQALYGASRPPRVVGERDEEGLPLLRHGGELEADAIARAVASRLRRRGVRVESVAARVDALDAMRREPIALPVVRTPAFCSGCPHSASTGAADDTLVGVGIGCHSMVLLNPEGRGALTGITQMGGEGAQWIGMAPWVRQEHFVQNLGDGTFHHSGSLAVRASVAAGTNITYKLLANGVVAMTGAQGIEGGMSVAELTRWLALEGVARVVVTTEDPGRYAGAALAPIASVRPREELAAVQAELAQVPGTTVLIHDQACAAETRRLRKRGLAPEAPERVVVNERVCEGCGDCGVKSACLSVVPIETEFGRKTQVHQASCNTDRSCLQGDCPSFLTVVPGTPAPHVVPDPPAGLPEPVALVDPAAFTVRMVGIGGTGVVTLAQVIGMAAHLEGKHVSGLDQTGLAQKGGPVVSDLRVSDTPITGSNRAGTGAADLYLGLDLLGAAAPKHLRAADPGRTVAVVSTSAVPTGSMVVDPSVRFPELDRLLDAIDRRTRRADGLHLDAQRLSERLFGTDVPANVVVLGAAFQRGALPLAAASIEAAIELNGAGVARNLAAFAWGRACVTHPDAVAALEPPPRPATSTALTPRCAALVARVGAPAGSELRRLLELRVPELVAYQGPALAEGYVALVAAALAAEREAGTGTAVAEAVARMHHKLLAYKDEYEVARLHLDAVERARLQAEFGADAVVRFHLQPPFLRALGMDRKLVLGPWFTPVLRALRHGKRLRGTPLDPFGRAEVRRVERALPAEYEAAVRAALPRLRPDTAALVAELADSPDLVRGYEEVKLRNVARWREELAATQARLAASTPATLRDEHPAGTGAR